MGRLISLMLVLEFGACVGLDFLRLGLGRKHYFEEGDPKHTGLGGGWF